MDLREKKTKRSINKAFLELRSKKSTQRITVKELSELAEISKATFYLHYRDIYDLSETLQNHVIKDIIASIKHPEYFLSDNLQFTMELFRAFLTQRELVDILFSGDQSSILTMSIEKELKEYLKSLSHNQSDEFDILLSFAIHGACYVYSKYEKRYDMDRLIKLVSCASDNVMKSM